MLHNDSIRHYHTNIDIVKPLRKSINFQFFDMAKRNELLGKRIVSSKQATGGVRMPRLFKVIVITILMIGLLIPGQAISSGERPVFIVNIKGEIDGGQAALLHRAMADAAKHEVRAVLVELDTFGGLVDAAVRIRDMMIDSPVTTICYIRNRAWSAGALIALSHKHIAIAPGGSIGAAEPIPTTEKTVAALKAEFAATANKTGRNPRVAEAMVDKTLGFPGYAETGQILALTDYQAMQVGYADIVAIDREAVLASYGLTGAPLVEYNLQWPEKLASWLSNPTVKSMLVSIIFLAVLTEIKTAGVGGAALIAMAAAALFFGSQWLTGLAGLWEILLFLGGLVLIIIELFVPGMGVFGIAGIVAILTSFFLTLGGDVPALTSLSLSLIIAVAIFLFLAKRLPTSKLWSRLVLKDAETTQGGYISAQDYVQYIGKEGIAETLLRPAGSILIEGVRLDVISEGKYIQPGTRVKVVDVTGNRILVQPIEK